MDMKIKRDTRGRFAKNNLKWKLLAITVIVILLVVGVNYGLYQYNRWSATHERIWQFPIDLSFKRITFVREREPKIISPLAEKAVEDETELTPIEQKVIDLWGYRDGVLALAIFECGESGLNPDAVGLTSDLGIAQVHWPTHGRQLTEKFGYTPADMFDVDKCLESAHFIWDKADGEVGNGEGNFLPWVGFTNDDYLKCFK